MRTLNLIIYSEASRCCKCWNEHLHPIIITCTFPHLRTIETHWGSLLAVSNGPPMETLEGPLTGCDHLFVRHESNLLYCTFCFCATWESQCDNCHNKIDLSYLTYTLIQYWILTKKVISPPYSVPIGKISYMELCIPYQIGDFRSTTLRFHIFCLNPWTLIQWTHAGY